jgi:integrase
MSDHIRVWVIGSKGRRCFQLQWRDPISRRLITKTTAVEQTGLRRARRDAQRLADELEQRLNAGEAVLPSKYRWEDFRRRYEAEVASGLAGRTREKIASVLDRLEREVAPHFLWDVDERRLSAYAAILRTGNERTGESPLAESTIHGHLSHIKAALNWAKAQKLIPQVPAFPRIKRARLSKGTKVMRGRPITLEEFERMLAEVPNVVGQQRGAEWSFFLRGLWASGLRLTESQELYWDQTDKLHPILTGRFPMLRITAALEKGHKDRLLPMAPEFARLLETVPPRLRTGPVFPLQRLDGKAGRMSPHRVSKVVSAIGARAKVRVDTRKTASAHDLRRAFGERWAARLMPAQLMELMRHESIETTLTYYVGRNAERTAAALWEQDRQESEPRSGKREAEGLAGFGIDADGEPRSL